MSEQRLIDANAVEVGFDELCQSPYFKNDVSAKHGAETLMDLCVRSDDHKPNTIDPETLPIVRELRETLQEAFTFDKICANCKHLEYQDFYAVCGKGILGIVHPSDYCSRFVKAEKPVKKFCVNCKFWDDFNGVCFNHDSIHDGAYEVRACEKYEKKDGRENATD